MRILGIDYSLNGTGLSVYDGLEIVFKKVFTVTKKFYEQDKNTFILSPKFKNYEYKIDWVVDNIINCTDYDFVCIEDHIGSYYNWMDGYGIIRHYLRKNNKPYIMISPTQLKKYAGTGKADKDKMTELLKQEYGFDLEHIGRLANNIVDATWLAIVGFDYYERFKLNKHTTNKERTKILDLIYEKESKLGNTDER